MVDILSFRHITMTINGHEVQGWALEDPPVEFEKIDIYETVFGPDGTLYANDRGQLGGEVSLMLLPVSPTALRIIRWWEERQNDQRLTFDATYQDTLNQISLRMTNGILTQADPTIVPGKNYEATFLFERFTADVDGARFNPPPPRQ